MIYAISIDNNLYLTDYTSAGLSEGIVARNTCQFPDTMLGLGGLLIARRPTTQLHLLPLVRGHAVFLYPCFTFKYSTAARPRRSRW